MSLALEQARLAFSEGEVPVGALVALDGQVIAVGRNAKERLRDPTAHAEVLALREAASRLGRWRLAGCSLVVTLEPCAMCAGAIVNARIGRVVYGAADPKAGACESLYAIPADTRLNHRPPVVGGVLAKACGRQLSRFFAARRAARKARN